MAPFQGEFCSAELVGPHIALVTMRRQAAMNAYNSAMLTELEQAWAWVRSDHDVWVAILTGEGDRAFSAGHDVKEETDPALEAMRPGSYGHDEARYLHGFGFHGVEVDKPIIAAVKGYCLGGGLAMALSCDLRVAGDNAQFGFPQTRLGALSAVGITHLQRAVGITHASEMMLSGDMFDADYAYRVGLVNRVVPVADVLDTAVATATWLCEAAPLAMRLTKRLMRQAAQAPFETSLELVHRAGAYLRETEDGREAAAAFREKRKPVWRGR